MLSDFRGPFASSVPCVSPCSLLPGMESICYHLLFSFYVSCMFFPSFQCPVACWVVAVVPVDAGVARQQQGRFRLFSFLFFSCFLFDFGHSSCLFICLGCFSVFSPLLPVSCTLYFAYFIIGFSIRSFVLLVFFFSPRAGLQQSAVSVKSINQ